MAGGVGEEDQGGVTGFLKGQSTQRLTGMFQQWLGVIDAEGLDPSAVAADFTAGKAQIDLLQGGDLQHLQSALWRSARPWLDENMTGQLDCLLSPRWGARRFAQGNHGAGIAGLQFQEQDGVAVLWQAQFDAAGAGAEFQPAGGFTAAVAAVLKRLTIDAHQEGGIDAGGVDKAQARRFCLLSLSWLGKQQKQAGGARAGASE